MRRCGERELNKAKEGVGHKVKKGPLTTAPPFSAAAISTSPSIARALSPPFPLTESPFQCAEKIICTRKIVFGMTLLALNYSRHVVLVPLFTVQFTPFPSKK